MELEVAWSGSIDRAVAVAAQRAPEVVSVHMRGDPMRPQLLAVLRAPHHVGRHWTQKELATMVNREQNSIHAALNTLVRERIVTKVDTRLCSRQTARFRYFLADGR